MPVTARLSKLLYEQLGEQVVNELVDWFNAVDATYRADLREINEQNYARFEAKLEQRIAELRGELHIGFAQMKTELEQLKVAFERTLRDQTRWFIAAWAALVVAWATLVALNLAMWSRLP